MEVKMRKIIIAVCIFVLSLIIALPVYAKVTDHPIFPTKEEVLQWISSAVNDLNNKITNLSNRVTNTENQLTQTKKVIFKDDFSGTSVDTSKWVPTDGWSENLVLTIDGGERGYTKKSDFSDFTLDIDFQINGRSDFNTANLCLRMTPDNPWQGSYYLVEITSKTSQFSPNSIRVSRGPVILEKVIPIPFEIKNGEWHHFKAKVEEYTFSFFIDGKFIGRYRDNIRLNHVGESMRREGAIGFFAHGIPGSIYSDLVNYANLEVTQ